MLNDGNLFPNPKHVAPFCLQIASPSSSSSRSAAPPQLPETATRRKSRPSSSSEVVLLLPSGAATMGFGGYVGNSRVDSSLTSISDGSTFLDIDALLAVQLKRLSRKDPATKLNNVELDVLS